jgi:hypothetical protein
MVHLWCRGIQGYDELRENLLRSWWAGFSPQAFCHGSKPEIVSRKCSYCKEQILIGEWISEIIE